MAKVWRASEGSMMCPSCTRRELPAFLTASRVKTQAKKAFSVGPKLDGLRRMELSRSSVGRITALRPNRDVVYQYAFTIQVSYPILHHKPDIRTQDVSLLLQAMGERLHRYVEIP